MKGFFSFDAVLAVVVLISMISFTALMINSIERSADALAGRENQMRLLVLSDIFVRREFAETTRSAVHSNVIDLASISSAASASNFSAFRMSNVSIELTGADGTVIGSSSTLQADAYCIQRIVFVKGPYDGPAVLKVCGS
ncbi:Uncharacterised protein [uncultured archaeon]|nr:Uncharacterised protein [uncultured archaeon]